MPYFVYELSPPRSLKRLECFQNYREARTAARALRQALPADSGRSARSASRGRWVRMRRAAWMSGPAVRERGA